MNFGKSKPDPEAIKLATQHKQCVVCKNYRAVHPLTKISYCMDGSKTVFADSGCSSWQAAINAKGATE